MEGVLGFWGTWAQTIVLWELCNGASPSTHSYPWNKHSFLEVVVWQEFKGGNYSKKNYYFFENFSGIRRSLSICTMWNNRGFLDCNQIDFNLDFNIQFIVLPQSVFLGGSWSAETNWGRKLLIIRRFWMLKLYKGGNYSRAETIRGYTVFVSISLLEDAVWKYDCKWLELKSDHSCAQTKNTISTSPQKYCYPIILWGVLFMSPYQVMQFSAL